LLASALIKARADLEQRRDNGNTPLLLAVTSAGQEMTKLLVSPP